MLSNITQKTSVKDDSFGSQVAINALDALQDYIVIIDYKINSLMWCSSRFSARFPSVVNSDIQAKCLYKKFRGLHHAVERFLNEVNDKCFDVAVARNNDKKDQHPAKCFSVYYGEAAELFEVEISLCGFQQLVLRFFDAAEKVYERQRYLEDREKLFSTSRTISVSEMATTLAHEINQPIGTIANLLQGIRTRMQVKPTDVARKALLTALDKTIEQTAFAANIITRIRDYTHSRRPEYELVSVTELVKSCISLLDWEISREGVVISFDEESLNQMQGESENIPPLVKGDKTLLQQVLVNLLRNAIDAMNTNSRGSRLLDISILADEYYVEITLSDTGSGLTAEAQEKLFVPFVSSKSTGMGVGLNICRSFIELHQGKLWLSSNADSGCTAHLRLPLAIDSELR